MVMFIAKVVAVVVVMMMIMINEEDGEDEVNYGYTNELAHITELCCPPITQ